MIDLRVESEVPEQNLNEAENVKAFITGPKDEVLLFLEGAFTVQAEMTNIESLSINGEEIDAVSA